MDFDRLLFRLSISMLAAILGYRVVSRVPRLLHTPRMASTDAVSGISLVSFLISAGAD